MPMKTILYTAACLSFPLLLSGCAVPLADAPDQYDASKSFAWNVQQHMLGDTEDRFDTDPDWDNWNDLLDRDKGYYLTNDTEPTINADTLTQILKKQDADRKSKLAGGSGELIHSVANISDKPEVALIGAGVGAVIAITEWFIPDGFTEPHDYQWLQDQYLFYLPKSKYPDSVTAEKALHKILKTAFEKADFRITMQIDRRCGFTELSAKPKTDPLEDNADAEQELYGFVFYNIERGADPTIENCSKPWINLGAPPQADSVIPTWMKNGGQPAWIFRSYNGMLDTPASEKSVIQRAVKKLPDNFYFYFAPRKQDGHIVPAVIYDNRGRHEFVAPGTKL